jgi:hypothetical protein
MLGFVDVSNMSSQQIKRLGQMDEDETLPRAKSRPATMQYSADDVWGAAVAAQRINGAYLKEAFYKTNEDGSAELVKKRNRDVMMDFLCVPGTITDEDRTQGRECLRFLQNDLTFRALKGQLSAFDASVSKVIAVENHFDSKQHSLELAVIACLPQSHQRSIARQEVQSRVQQSAGVFGAIGDKVTLEVEVVSANYSKNYNIFWVTAITQDNRAVFFSYKSKLITGSWIQIQGAIKAHRDDKTQLNRVKVL